MICVSSITFAFSPVNVDFDNTADWTDTDFNWDAIAGLYDGGTCNGDATGTNGSSLYRTFGQVHPCWSVNMSGDSIDSDLWNITILDTLPAGWQRSVDYVFGDRSGSSGLNAIEMTLGVQSAEIYNFKQISNGVLSTISGGNSGDVILGKEQRITILKKGANTYNFSFYDTTDGSLDYNIELSNFSIDLTNPQYFEMHFNDYPNGNTYYLDDLSITDNNIATSILAFSPPENEWYISGSLFLDLIVASRFSSN